VMIKIPPLTTERRKDLTKVVSREWEDAKVGIRNHRHDARKKVDHLLADETISKNEKENGYKEIDEIAKNYNDAIDQHVKAKSIEVMKV
jgi:ribosome recycling factor